MRKPSNNTFKIHSKESVPLIKWMDVFMERYGMSYSEFMELPIPTFYALADIIITESEEQSKKIKHG